MSALLYLVTRSFLNGVIFRLRRLRQPKYVLGALFGAAYLYFYFGKVLGGERSPLGPRFTSGAGFVPEIGALLLFVATLLLSWILPASRAAITFTEAEIAFLFPAPLRRSTLVMLRLVKSQIALLLFSAFMTLITGRFRLGAEAWLRVGGWWIILNTLNMHRVGASFALQRLRERGMADWKRRLAVVLALAGLVVLVEFTRRSLPPPPGLANAMKGGPDVLAQYAGQILGAGPLPYVLAPFKLVVMPNFAGSAGAFLDALPAALGIMALHFAWVVRADVSFEEAAIDAAKKRATALAAVQRGEIRARSTPTKARKPLWRLRPRGFEPVAFWWKSVLKAGGRRTMGRWALFFLVLVACAIVLGRFEKPTTPVIVTAVVIGASAYIALIGSFIFVGQHAAAQLRQGIAAMDLLKTYPLPGWKLALGELTGPVVLGTLMQWCALGVGVLLLLVITPLKNHVAPVCAVAAGLALFLPAFNFANAVLPSAGALLFPGWFRTPEGQAPGIESAGLRLLVGVGQLLAIVAALLPVALLAAAAWFSLGKIMPALEWRALAAGGTAMLILTMEAGLGIAWLGSLYDRFDLSED